MFSRRRLLQGVAGGISAAAMLQPTLSLARLEGERRLAIIILRGGLDGLAALPPHGDPRYRRARGELALDAPGREGGILDLDGFFGLHPNLAPLHSLYRQRELLAIHATAMPYRARSHFDAQDVLENGTNRPGGARDGWLNRALGTLERGNGTGLALGRSVPLILRGRARVASWSPNVLPMPEPTLMAQIEERWRHDPLLGPNLREGLRMRALDQKEMAGGRGLRGLYGPRGFATFAEKAGQMLSEDEGPRVAVMEMGGWDTHANQGREAGRLAKQFTALSDGVSKLNAALGPAWRNTVIIVVSEFGRTISGNGTGGTDHGVAGAAFLFGGAVDGGRVLADWPGLKRRQLYEGRDLRPTLDTRAIFKAVLRDHLGVDVAALEKPVFPESAAVEPLGGLIKV